MDLRYRDILVYNTFRTDSGKLVIYNIFDNSRTYSYSVKAIEQFKQDGDREKLRNSIEEAVKTEQLCRFEYESVISDVFETFSTKIDTYEQFYINIDLFIDALIQRLK
jgi:hypothetical protein